MGKKNYLSSLFVKTQGIKQNLDDLCVRRSEVYENVFRVFTESMMHGK